MTRPRSHAFSPRPPSVLALAAAACLSMAACSDGSDGGAVGPGASPAGFETFTSSGPGRTLTRLLHRPADETGAPHPPYVALHGCSQTAEQLADVAHLAELASTHDAYVVVPQQDLSANAVRCWPWFDPSSQQRTGGEPEILAGIVQQAMSMGSVDPARVHVFGLSASATMAVVLYLARASLAVSRSWSTLRLAHATQRLLPQVLPARGRTGR